MVDDQAKAIDALKAEFSAGNRFVHAAIDRAYEIGQAVSISRASQGSGVGTEDSVERLRAYASVLETEVADLKSLDSHAEWQRLDVVVGEQAAEIERLNAAISALSPLATPQASEDVRARAIELLRPYMEESDAMIGAAVDEITPILATPVTVTQQECRQIASIFCISSANTDTWDMAEALLRVLGDRIQISGSEGPK